MSDTKTGSSRYAYRTEPLRPALILVAFFGLGVIVLPSANLQFFALAFMTGPLAFAALQCLRRGCGIVLSAEQITLQNSLTRRRIAVPLSQVQRYQRVGDGLALVWYQARKQTSGDEARPPRLRLYVSAALAEPEALIAALDAVPRAPTKITPAHLTTLIGWRRVRRVLIGIAALFGGIPALFWFGLRLVAVIHAIFGLR